MLLAVDGGRPLLLPGAWIAYKMFCLRDWLDLDGVPLGIFDEYYENMLLLAWNLGVMLISFFISCSKSWPLYPFVITDLETLLSIWFIFLVGVAKLKF